MESGSTVPAWWGVVSAQVTAQQAGERLHRRVDRGAILAAGLRSDPGVALEYLLDHPADAALVVGAVFGLAFSERHLPTVVDVVAAVPRDVLDAELPGLVRAALDEADTDEHERFYRQFDYDVVTQLLIRAGQWDLLAEVVRRAQRSGDADVVEFTGDRLAAYSRWGGANV